MKMSSMTCVELGNSESNKVNKSTLLTSAKTLRTFCCITPTTLGNSESNKVNKSTLLTSAKTFNKGFLVFDFMFAFLITIGMSMLLLITNYTLSMMEVVQYMTFASSRSYHAADFSKEDQEQAAIAKFENLREQKILKNLLNKNLFIITSEHGDHSAHFEDNNNKNLVGTKTSVSAKVLSKSLPIIGSAGSENDFQTTVISMLGREPSMMECMSFAQNKAQQIQGLYSELEGFNAYNFWDNGC